MNQQSISVILNSGSTSEEKEKLAENISRAFADNGGKATIITINKGDDFKQVAEKHIKIAKENGTIIAAAGGDGTINLAAGLCYKHQVTLGIIPLGTFNYFARELSISTEIEEAVKIIVTGNIRKATVGLVNENVFLNNASFGLYTKLIRQRENASSRFGRVRIIAALAAAYSLFDRHKLFRININSDTTHNTSMVFIGNNTLQLENLGMNVSECTKQDKLAVVIMKNSSRLEIARFLLRGAIKNLKDESKLQEFCADTFEVNTSRKNIDLVIDGEIIRVKTPLSFSVKKNALNVMVPA